MEEGERRRGKGKKRAHREVRGTGDAAEADGGVRKTRAVEGQVPRPRLLPAVNQPPSETVKDGTSSSAGVTTPPGPSHSGTGPGRFSVSFRVPFRPLRRPHQHDSEPHPTAPTQREDTHAVTVKREQEEGEERESVDFSTYPTSLPRVDDQRQLDPARPRGEGGAGDSGGAMRESQWGVVPLGLHSIPDIPPAPLSEVQLVPTMSSSRGFSLSVEITDFGSGRNTIDLSLDMSGLEVREGRGGRGRG